MGIRAQLIDQPEKESVLGVVLGMIHHLQQNVPKPLSSGGIRLVGEPTQRLLEQVLEFVPADVVVPLGGALMALRGYGDQGVKNSIGLPSVCPQPVREYQAPKDGPPGPRDLDPRAQRNWRPR